VLEESLWSRRPCDEIHEADGRLSLDAIGCGHDGVRHAVAPHIADHADDLHPCVLALRRPGRPIHAAPNRVLPGKEAIGGRLADDGGEPGASYVSIGEVAPAQDGNSHRSEVSRRDDVLLEYGDGAGRPWRSPLDDELS